MMRKASQVRDLVAPAGGMLIWAAHFTSLYAAQTAFCTLGGKPENVARLRLAGIVLAAIAIAALVGVGRSLLADVGSTSGMPSEAQAARFLRELATVTVGAALLAVVWSLFPLLALPPCGAPAG
jgi:hypothetical protein